MLLLSSFNFNHKCWYEFIKDDNKGSNQLSCITFTSDTTFAETIILILMDYEGNEFIAPSNRKIIKKGELQTKKIGKIKIISNNLYQLKYEKIETSFKSSEAINVDKNWNWETDLEEYCYIKIEGQKMIFYNAENEFDIGENSETKKYLFDNNCKKCQSKTF